MVELESKQGPAGIAPEQYPGLLPSRPLMASDTNHWRRVTLQRYHHPPSDIILPPARDPVMALQLGGPVPLEDQDEGGHWTRRWFQKGEIHLQPAGRSVRRILGSHSDVLLIHIAPELVSEVAQEAYDVDPRQAGLIRRLAVPDKTLDRLGRLLLRKAEVGGSGTGLVADALGTIITLNLLRRHSELSSTEVKRPAAVSRVCVRKVIQHMHDCLGERLSLRELAAMAGLSQSQFVNTFREATGHPPHQYLILIRIERARNLLEHTSSSVAEIGMSCGFEQSKSLCNDVSEGSRYEPS